MSDEYKAGDTGDPHETRTHRDNDPHEANTNVPGASSERATPEFPVSDWDRYKFIAYVGEGGMGRVYRAMDLQLGREVALKFIRGDEGDALERFVREARAQARLNHDHICKIYETGEVDGKRYIAMQYIDGLTLSRVRDKLMPEQKVKLMQEVCEGIQAAHRIGLIHRDIKPGNIMVEKSEDGWHPYVLDFGLARETQAQGITMTGAMVGTPGFMAPEQAWGDAHFIDRRMDVYSLGATLYFLLGGVAPYEAESTMITLRKMLQEDPKPLGQVVKNISPDLETIVMKCLEKEPERRYDSARALADDLHRWLNGEPVAARRASLAYRLRTRAKKNKTLVAVSAAAIIAIITLAFYGIRTTLKARERATLAQRFGQQVERMDAILRVGHTIPLHDTRLERGMIRNQMRQISTQMDQLGSVAKGPGNYAMGRGYLSLDDYDSATKHLQESWDSGYREPEVAYALGLALGRIYQRELESVDNIRNKEVREATRKELEKKYRNPAVRYLRSSQGAETSAPEYVEGLIDLYEKRYEPALVKAQAAWKRLPWLYEARLLEGNIYTAIANKKRLEGESENAYSEYAKARKAYEAAIEIGESDGEAYEGLCALSLNIMYTRIYSTGGDLTPDVNLARADCNKALQSDPDRAGPYVKLANVFWIYGNALSLKAEDPSAALKESIDAAQHAIRLDPKNPLGYKNLGTAYQLLGNYDRSEQRDPNPNLTLAIHSYTRAMDVAPADISVHNSLGNTYAIQGDYERENGRDPRKFYRQSIETFEKGIAANATFAYIYSNLGVTYKDLSMYEEAHGFDPVPNMNKASEKYKKCLELKPDDTLAWNNLGNNYKNLAQHYMRTGRNPEAMLKEGRLAAEKAIQINPEYATPHSNLSEIWRLQALWEIWNDRNPAESLRLAEEVQLKHQNLRKNDPRGMVELAEVYLVRSEYELKQNMRAASVPVCLEQIRAALKDEGVDRGWAYQRLAQAKLLEARFLVRDGKSPQQAFQEAKTAIDESLKDNALNALVWKDSAKITWFQIRGSKTPDMTEVRKGLEAVEKALQIHPRLAEALALRGKLYEQLATNENHEQNRKLAQDAWNQAMKLNPYLAHLL